jgi:hypothetical protein
MNSVRVFPSDAAAELITSSAVNEMRMLIFVSLRALRGLTEKPDAKVTRALLLAIGAFRRTRFDRAEAAFGLESVLTFAIARNL